MKGNRPSVLDVSRYCGLAGRLGAKYGTGRAAVMGQAFHAACAGEPDANSLLQSLLPEEATEVMGWHKPTEFEIPDIGEVLSYDEAEVEVELAIDRDGEALNYEDPNAFTRGIIDMLWETGDDLGDLIVVRDIKKQRWTVDWGPDGTLQLHCYGWMAAKLAGVARYSIGLWLAVEGEWIHGPTVDTTGFDGAEIWGLLEHAISNQSDTGTTGAYCRNCYARPHCPEWLLPGALIDGWARPLCEGADLDKITRPEALALLLRVQATEDLAKRAKENLAVVAERLGGIPDPTCGKVWRMVERAGSETVDKKSLRADLGAEAEKYFKRGKGSVYPDWRNGS
jgi:hypothetical protein